jgi:NRDE-2, necessary for RNA interference
MSKVPVIPKFASFKGPPKRLSKSGVAESTSNISIQPLTIATTVKSGQEKKHRNEDSERKSHKHRHRGDEDGHSRSRSPAKHRDKRRRTISPSPQPQSRQESDLYKIDLKGDSSNITYGIIYRYSVPAFHRFGAGYILGLPTKWRIDREKGEGKGLVVGIRGYDADKRRRGGNMFAVDASRVGRLKAVEGIQKGFGPNDEFVPVSGRAEDLIEEDVGVQPDYRSIEGKSKVTAPEDIESVSSEDEGTFSYSEELRQRTIELDRKLQSHPHDIKAWLDYVSLQDEIGVGQKASTAEIKLGMLQKGLEKNPGNPKLFVEIFKLESILFEHVSLYT